ncbi:hypothetical protein FHX34_10114 [Actinoplanes teichomyceticus]|uniref:Uncharacterized protein n=1 Tax=Actinoplanes teichomyceticus TaxID=1867 RepID=A0A561WMH2_ACTTI|nr:hypothetical protein FHX34_10114 [Actinoplanes teichomyceticus]GIF10125.1 hypothetical protein Ate01nite_01570 [Actinoplanes teichomyceticus]
MLTVDVPSTMLHGGADEGYGPVVDAVRRNFAEKREIGSARAVYRGGRKVVDLCGGYRDGVAREVALRHAWSTEVLGEMPQR